MAVDTPNQALVAVDTTEYTDTNDTTDTIDITDTYDITDTHDTIDPTCSNLQPSETITYSILRQRSAIPRTLVGYKHHLSNTNTTDIPTPHDTANPGGV